MTYRIWMTVALLAALGCDPCPHNKCLYASISVRIVAADTGKTLVSNVRDPSGQPQAFATIEQDGQSRTIDALSSMSCGDGCLGGGIGPGDAVVSASAPGYQTAQKALKVESTACGGVVLQSLTFTLVPEHSTLAPSTTLGQGGSSICGEGE